MAMINNGLFVMFVDQTDRKLYTMKVKTMSNNTSNISEIINKIIEERAKGNPVIAEMTKAKLILKGIYPDRYDSDYLDEHPDTLEKLIEIKHQWNAEEPKVGNSVSHTAFSKRPTEEEVVLDIQSQFDGTGVKVIIYFASPSYDQNKLNYLMEKAFSGNTVSGCSTAGERIDEQFLTGSVVALGLCSNLIADAKVEPILNLSGDFNIKSAFKSFNIYFQESTYRMDTSKYVGIVLTDGLSSKEEIIMDEIGNLTNVSFVGASAADDLKFDKTYVYANGKAYTDAAILILLKMQDNAKFSILKTQSFTARKGKLVANKVNLNTREVIEFNNKPAAQAYVEALGNCVVEELPEHFLNHPVGLLIDDNNILVRSPQTTDGSSIKFSCSILEDMEVRLLDSGDIVEETTKVIEQRKQESTGTIEGILIFDCVHRRIEIENKNLISEYSEIFKDIPTIGFFSYGEAYIGHMNQTATMLIFEYNRTHPNVCNSNSLDNSENKQLSKINQNLERENKELKEKLDFTTAELKKFNISLAEEINKRTKREAKIKYLSYHDDLTGLYNHRFYRENIADLDTESNLPLSIIFGDVNGLKEINDTLGHALGNELLQKTAEAIKSSCRENDKVMRLGGDEFLIFLPQTSKEDSTKIVKYIIENSSQHYVNGKPISISFGLDTKENINQIISEVIRNAENYMYENKNNFKDYN